MSGKLGNNNLEDNVYAGKWGPTFVVELLNKLRLIINDDDL